MAQAADTTTTSSTDQVEVKSDKLKDPRDLMVKGSTVKSPAVIGVLPAGFGYSKADVDAGNVYLSPIRNKDYKISAIKISYTMTPVIDNSSNPSTIKSFTNTIETFEHLQFEDPFRDCNKLHCTIRGRPTSETSNDITMDIFENFGVRTSDDKKDSNMLEFEDYNYYTSNNNDNNNNDNEDAKNDDNNNNGNKVSVASIKDALHPIGGWWLETGDSTLDPKQKIILFFRPLITNFNEKNSKLDIIDNAIQQDTGDTGDNKYKWYLAVKKVKNMVEELEGQINQDGNNFDTLEKVVTVEGIAKVFGQYAESTFLKKYQEERYNELKNENGVYNKIEFVVFVAIQSFPYRVSMNNGQLADVYIG